MAVFPDFATLYPGYVLLHTLRMPYSLHFVILRRLAR